MIFFRLLTLNASHGQEKRRKGRPGPPGAPGPPGPPGPKENLRRTLATLAKNLTDVPPREAEPLGRTLREPWEHAAQPYPQNRAPPKQDFT